jgi:hypothetical protein
MLSPTPNTFSSDLNRAKNKTTRKQQQPSATESVQTLKSITSNKGNNKITELRTILQRESQNSSLNEQYVWYGCKIIVCCLSYQRYPYLRCLVRQNDYLESHIAVCIYLRKKGLL